MTGYPSTRSSPNARGCGGGAATRIADVRSRQRKLFLDSNGDHDLQTPAAPSARCSRWFACSIGSPDTPKLDAAAWQRRRPRDWNTRARSAREITRLWRPLRQNRPAPKVEDQGLDKPYWTCSSSSATSSAREEFKARRPDPATDDRDRRDPRKTARRWYRLADRRTCRGAGRADRQGCGHPHSRKVLGSMSTLTPIPIDAMYHPPPGPAGSSGSNRSQHQPAMLVVEPHASRQGPRAASRPVVIRLCGGPRRGSEPAQYSVTTAPKKNPRSSTPSPASPCGDLEQVHATESTRGPGHPDGPTPAAS